MNKPPNFSPLTHEYRLIARTIIMFMLQLFAFSFLLEVTEKLF